MTQTNAQIALTAAVTAVARGDILPRTATDFERIQKHRTEFLQWLNEQDEVETFTKDDVYSNVTLDGVRLTWKENSERLSEQLLKLQPYALMLSDLDRNSNGRHEGDIDGYTDSGVSEGNPHLKEGQVIGYNISGHPYIVPPAGQRGKLDSWRMDP